MKKIAKFIELDFITVKPFITLKNFIVVIAIAIFYIYINKSVAGSLAIVCAFTTNYVSYPFAVGDQNGIDALYVMLGIERRTVVIGRYIWALIMNIAGIAFAVVLSLIFSLVFGIPIDLKEMLMVVVALLMLFTLTQAAQLSLFFKTGYLKSKSFAYVPMMLMMALIIGISTLGGYIPQNQVQTIITFIYTHIQYVVLLIVCVWIGAIFTSYTYSMRKYAIREF